jgi:AGZA family xanthine/uracil permease-like MFS transporter
MMRQITSINWRYIGDAVPAFVTVMFIPFGYSAAYGLIAGLMVYTALNGMIYLTKLISRGRIVPDDEDQREYWTIKPFGKLPWFLKAGQALADHARGSDSSQIEDYYHHDRLGSKGSNPDAELERVVCPAMPRDPDHEKVLRKL